MWDSIASTKYIFYTDALNNTWVVKNIQYDPSNGKISSFFPIFRNDLQ